MKVYAYLCKFSPSLFLVGHFLEVYWQSDLNKSNLDFSLLWNCKWLDTNQIMMRNRNNLLKICKTFKVIWSSKIGHSTAVSLPRHCRELQLNYKQLLKLQITPLMCDVECVPVRRTTQHARAATVDKVVRTSDVHYPHPSASPEQRQGYLLYRVSWNGDPWIIIPRSTILLFVELK